MKRFKRRGKCYFCENRTEPDFGDFEVLVKFISDRGKIIAAGRTGTCAIHQRRLAQAIKRARFLSLLSFTAKIN